MSDFGFPPSGRDVGVIGAEVERLRAEDAPTQYGAMEAYWPVLPESVLEVGRAAQATYAHLNSFALPWMQGYQQIDRGVRGAVADLFGADSYETVTLTAGGTESNYLAVKSARNEGRKRGVHLPNMVLCKTAHPSFDKAGEELGVQVRRISACTDWSADFMAMEAALDADTVLMVGSMPSYPHGVPDDIPILAAICERAGVWLHVDAAVGGFMHPHIKKYETSLPEFDFRVAGVRSITADLHKLGLCITGISTFTVRDPSLMPWALYRSIDVWPRGPFARQGFLGSRPGGVVAAAWAIIQHLGRDGYEAIAREISEGQHRAARGVGTIDGLTVVRPPSLGQFAVATEDPALLGRLAASLDQQGWVLGVNAEPPSLQVFILPTIDLDRFLEDLESAWTRVRDEAWTPDAKRVDMYGEA